MLLFLGVAACADEMSSEILRSDDDPARAGALVASRRPPVGAERWRWPALGRLQRVGVALVAVVLLLTVAIEIGHWLAPGWLGHWLSDAAEASLHHALHIVQGAAALVLLVGAGSWLLYGGRDRAEVIERASAIEGAIESMTAGLAIYDGKNRLVACNDAFRRLYPEVVHLLVPGAMREDLLRAYYPHAPATLIEGRSLEQYLGAALRRRQPDLPMNDRVRYMHGQWVMMSDCRTADGGLICLRSVLSEEELRAMAVSRQRRAMDDLADLTHDGFWRTDAEGRLVELSPAMAVIAGRSREELLGRRVDELAGFWFDDAQQGVLERRMRERRPFPWFRFRIERADGTATWLAACGKPVLHADGRFDGYYGAARDISEAESTIHALRRDEERFRALARLVTEWYWEVDAGLRYTLVRGSSEFDTSRVDDMMGQPFGQSAIGRVDDADRRAATAAMQRREPLKRMPLRVRYADQPDRVFEISAEPMFRGETFVGYRGLSLDVTERAMLIERLLASEARFRALTELSSDWYWEMDSEYRFTRIEYGSRLSRPGLPPSEELLGRRRWDLDVELVHPTTWDEHRALLQARRPYRDLLSRKRGEDGNFRYVASSGDPIFDANGAFLGYRGVSTDVTDQVRAKESIEKLATIDSLTGLANRHAFDERARAELLQARSTGRRCALLFIDLDNFRLLNNGYGHRAGDVVLCTVAERLRREIPEPRLLGRRGGDELVALIGDAQAPGATVEAARRLIEVISTPMPVLGLELTVTPSIGISFFPHDGGDLEALVNAADAAMYEAKQNGRATYALYTPAVARRVDLRLRLEQRLRTAVESTEFRLYFQPTVSLADGRIVGAEVLVRWTDAEVGEVSPAEFIPIAEESGLVVGLGDWGLREACKARQAWRAAGLDMPTLAVNIAGVHLRQVSYVDTVLDTLAEHGVQPDEVEIEVTETGLLDTSATVRENLVRLRRAGVRLALDDFGVGFSSLAHLRDLPIHRLKIDRSFTVECMRDPRTLTIVKAVIEMARALGIKITAEGVETQAQQDWMEQLGCDSAQGYLFSRPLTSDEFMRTVLEQGGAGRDHSLMH
jgi:diguanylate cyclase (GGDEF)-like protein/PAS domain S-box-containing protein